MISNANVDRVSAKASPSRDQSKKTKTGADSEESAEGGVASVDRALRILSTFSMTDPAQRLVDIADRTGLYKSTILRLSQSLIRARLLTRGADGLYRIGPMGLTLSAAYQASHSLGDVLMPIMNAIANGFSESVSFYVRDGDRRICLFRVDGPRLLRHHVSQGESLPLLNGSAGQVLAAYDGEKGPRFDLIRERGWQVSFGERDPEIAGLSVPVFGPDSTVVGAITVSGPITRITPSFVSRTVVPFLRHAVEATEGLGGDPAELHRAMAGHDDTNLEIRSA